MNKRLITYFNILFIFTLITITFSSLPVNAATAPIPVGPTPNSRHVEWYHWERIAFFHFGPNTWTGLHVGTGTEDPNIFNPTAMDCNQWIQAIKNAGFKTAILTAKHHDGFCLWPSAYTTHDVAGSSWKNHQGDVVKEFTDACHAAGIRVGIYLSPQDRHESTYDTPAYDDFFNNQLTELLTKYGTIDEVWWDGAGAAAGMNYQRWANTVRTLQPNAIIFAPKGGAPYADLRWVGNEDGIAGDPCWSLIDLIYSINEDTAMLNSGQVNGNTYLPAESDVSIRPSWFHRESENSQVKSADTLWNIYMRSVGHNSPLLLNFPPNQQGLIYQTDVDNAAAMAAVINNTFNNNLAAGASVTATDTRGPEYGPSYLMDGNEQTYYASSDGVTTPTVTFNLGSAKTFDHVIVQEVIQLGQRVTGWEVDAYYNNQWNTLVTKQCIGYKWIASFNPVTATQVRLRITGAKACPAIHTFGIFKKYGQTNIAQGKIASADSSQTGNGAANGNDGNTGTRWCANDGNANHWWKVDLGQNYNLSGSEVVWEMAQPNTIYKYKVEVSNDNTNWTLAVDKTNNTSAAQTQSDNFTVSARYVRITVIGISNGQWASFYEFRVFEGSGPPPAPGANLALNKTASADSQQTGHAPAAGNDGNTTTRWCANDGNANHWWMVDLGQNYSLTGSEVMWEMSQPNTIYKYKVEVSTDNINWTLKVDKTNNTGTVQTQSDNFAANARYVQITVTGISNGQWASFYEFRVFGTGNGAVFYQNSSYGGTATQVIPKGSYTLSQLQSYGFVNDWASSVKVNGNTVIMYADDNFSGTSWTLTADTPNFSSFSPNANDLVSSVKVQ